MPARKHLTEDDKGVANGVAELDANGRVPSSQKTPLDYTELNVTLGSTTLSTWVTIPTGYVNSLLTIVIYNGAANDRLVGVRAVGSVVERSFDKPKETTTTLQVLSDASGDIQIKSDGSASVSFTLVGDLL